jgi:DNA polymerase-1
MEERPVKLLIDTELFLFRAAAACEYEAEWAPDVWTYLCNHADAKDAFQGIVGELMEMAPNHQPVMVFGGQVSFRYAIYPHYKSNRRKLKKPAGFQALTDWVLTAAQGRGWETHSLLEVEGDDVLGLAAGEGDIVASDDKDMLTLPGLLLRNGEVLEISEAQADRNFFQQALTGDAADGYPGCPGIGPVKAERLLDLCSTPAEMWEAVVKAYLKAGKSEHFALQMARCARILRPTEYDHETKTPILWLPPQ